MGTKAALTIHNKRFELFVVFKANSPTLRWKEAKVRAPRQV